MPGFACVEQKSEHRSRVRDQFLVLREIRPSQKLEPERPVLVREGDRGRRAIVGRGREQRWCRASAT